MTPQSSTAIQTPMFTPQEERVLSALRQRYSRDRDLFWRPETARLSFMRWLYEQGKLRP